MRGSDVLRVSDTPEWCRGQWGHRVIACAGQVELPPGSEAWEAGWARFSAELRAGELLAVSDPGSRRIGDAL